MRVRFNLLIAVGFILFVLSCDTEGSETYNDYFIRYYGIDGDHYGADMTVNADGTIVILGTSEFPANSGSRRIYLAKADSEGNTLWEKLLGDYNENAKDIEPITAGTYAGGYMILSNKVVDISGNTIIKLLRVDADGNKIDSLELAAVYQPSNFGYSITTLLDGGVIVTGNSTDSTLVEVDKDLVNPVDKTDLLSLRYSESFLPDPVWQESFGAEPEVMGIKVFEINANQFYFAGYTNGLHLSETSDPANYDFDFWYTKLNGGGSFSGVEIYSGGLIEQERMNAITKSGLGEYFAVGSVAASGGNKRIFASRIVGNYSQVDRNETRNIEGEATSVAASGANKVLILADVVTAGGSRDIWLTKVTRDFVNEPGFPITFGATGNDDTSSAVTELPNGDILVLGTMNLVNQNKIALIKLKANGEF